MQCFQYLSLIVNFNNQMLIHTSSLDKCKFALITVTVNLNAVYTCTVDSVFIHHK